MRSVNSSTVFRSLDDFVNRIRDHAYGVMLITTTRAPACGDVMQVTGFRRRTSLLLVLLLIMPLLPLEAVSASNHEDDWMLQAEDISAAFEENGESTTVTWKSIINANFAQGLWDATYHLYRHDEVMNASMIANMTPFASVDACDEINVPNPNNCQGNAPDGQHSATFQVPPGINASYYYAITTELGDGTITSQLDFNESMTFQPVSEITTAVRSPYYLQAFFNPTTSNTTLSWVNYNSINPVLPESGPDAYDIHIWQHAEPITRESGVTLLSLYSPIATLVAGTSLYEVSIPVSTNRQMYYSVTYVLNNWIAPNTTYEDVRFLSGNTLGNPVDEDNVPPDAVQGVSASFESVEGLDGTGWTTITWTDVLGEEGENYRVWRAGSGFNNTFSDGVELIATVSEGISSYNYTIPRGNLGPSFYCVSIIDSYSITTSELITPSCSSLVFEDTFGSWIKEPTNVKAEYLGASKTKVSWTDQIGAEGETYNVWWSSYPVVVTNPDNPVEFRDSGALQNMFLLATVPDGFGEVIVDVPGGIFRTQSYYFVTSDARYGHLNDTYEYRGLIQNKDGPVTEDTLSPLVPIVNEVRMYGMTDEIIITWVNDDQENNEVYSIWRHLGDPFLNEESTFRANVSEENGWELMLDDIATDSSTQSTIIRSIQVAEGIQRNAWYSVVVKDEFDNLNNDMWSTPGKNAVMVREDATAATAILHIEDSTGATVESGTLQKGSYRLIINASENLESVPLVNISSEHRFFNIGAGEEANLLFDTPLDDSIGDTYYFDFEIANTDKNSLVTINITLSDSVANTGNISVAEWDIDAKLPSIEFYTPASPEHTTYMQGDPILISGGASDDVGVVSIEIRFITATSTGRWIDIIASSTQSEVGWAFAYPVAVGDFPLGTVRVEIRATDAAGNQNTGQVSFATDDCHQSIEGISICDGKEGQKAPPEVILENVSMGSGPFLFVFVLAGINVLALIVVIMTIISALSVPRKKKGDDDDEGDEWMSEFIGTSSEPDMDSITGGAKKEEKQVVDDDDDEEDPFAVNELVRKERRKKKGNKLNQTGSGDVSTFEHDDDDDDGGKKRRSIRRKK